MDKKDHSWNPWKLATFGVLIVLTTALVTGVVVANYVGKHSAPSASNNASDVAAVAPQPPLPNSGAPLPPSSSAGDLPPNPPQNVAPNPPQSASEPARPSGAAARPSRHDIKVCNRYAASARHHTEDTLKDALFGGALGAGLGAAGGAIAGGGSGAGKGAGIGGLVGVAGGTLYGLNQANQSDEKAAVAYRTCMKRRGYVD